MDDRSGQYEKLTPQLYGAIIDEAHQHDLLVTAHIWNLEDGKKTAEVAGYSGNVYQVLLADGNIYSTSADKTARQHQLDNREQKHVFGDHSDWVFALALDSNNQRLATGCYDGQIRIWNLADGSATLSFVAAPGTNSPPVKH